MADSITRTRGYRVTVTASDLGSVQTLADEHSAWLGADPLAYVVWARERFPGLADWQIGVTIRHERTVHAVPY